MAHNFKTAASDELVHGHQLTDDAPNGVSPSGSDIVTSRSERVVTASTAKEHARVDDRNGELDSYFENLIDEATDVAERYMNRSTTTKSVKFYYNRFPHGEQPFNMWEPPLQEVTDITYYTEDSGSQTLDSSEYEAVKRTRPRVYEAANKTWPSETLDPRGVEITADMGYGDNRGDVPAGIKAGIKELVKSTWDRPNPETEGSMIFESSMRGFSKLDKFKARNY